MADRERESRKRKLKQRVIIGSKAEEGLEEERQEEAGKAEDNPFSLTAKNFWLPFLLILFFLSFCGRFFLLWKKTLWTKRASLERQFGRN